MLIYLYKDKGDALCKCSLNKKRFRVLPYQIQKMLIDLEESAAITCIDTDNERAALEEELQKDGLLN